MYDQRACKHDKVRQAPTCTSCLPRACRLAPNALTASTTLRRTMLLWLHSKPHPTQSAPSPLPLLFTAT